jgi:hypothetical protein
LEKYYEIVVLGAGQIAQAVISHFKGKKILVISRHTEKVQEKYSIDGLNWTAGDSAPPSDISADIVINCIMPASKRASLAGIKLASRIRRDGGIYVHLSTIALKTIPRNYPRFLKFSGDIYMRIKRAELEYLRVIIPDVRIVYPGIVLGAATSWDKFFARLENTTKIVTGADLNLTAPIVLLPDLANVIGRTITIGQDGQETFCPSPTETGLPTWRELIVSRGIQVVQKSYLFFPSRVKNAVTVILTSTITPYFIWEKILTHFKKRSPAKDPSQSNVAKALVINGMTNFYIGCRYKTLEPRKESFFRSS